MGNALSGEDQRRAPNASRYPNPFPAFAADNSIKEENLAAIAKEDERKRIYLAAKSLFGGDEPPKEKSAPVPAWKTLITGWKGFSQLEIAA